MRDFFPVVFISILLTLFYSEHALIALEIRKKKKQIFFIFKIKYGNQGKGRK